MGLPRTPIPESADWFRISYPVAIITEKRPPRRRPRFGLTESDPDPAPVRPVRAKAIEKRALAQLNLKIAAAEKARLAIEKVIGHLEQLTTENNVLAESIDKIEAGLNGLKVRSASITSAIRTAVVEKDFHSDMLMKLGAEIFWLDGELDRLSSLAGEEGAA